MAMRTDAEIKAYPHSLPGANSPEESFSLFLSFVLGSHLGSVPNEWRRIADIVNNPHLKEKILGSIKSRDFRAVREVLAREFRIQDLPPRTVPTKTQNAAVLKRLRESFQYPFKGKAHEGLYNYLENNNRLFNASDPAKYYGKFCSIVQSSGTGKSRTMLELRNKGVIVLYINLRNENEINVFPPRDPLLADIITYFPQSANEYAAQCSALFTAIFRAIRIAFTWLSDSNSIVGAALIDAWNEGMCSFGSKQREDFFNLVKREYESIKAEISRSSSQTTPVVLSSTQTYRPGNAREGVGHEPTEESRASQRTEGQPSTAGIGPSSNGKRFQNDDPNLVILPGGDILRAEYDEWHECSVKLTKADRESDKPHLVIEFDEAQVLSDMAHRRYLPSHIFCRVISGYSRLLRPVWVLFASTSSRVADFSAPDDSVTSLRVSEGGEMLFPPYMHLGWDQHAAGIEAVKPTEVAQFQYLARLGRPLWHSLMHLEPNTERLMETARSKLCGQAAYDGKSPDAALAVLSARCNLDVCLGHRESNGFQTRGVASHMRVMQSMTADRLWQSTEYPSEPILACAAAELLYRKQGCLLETLEQLNDKITKGMIDIGRFGELVSRLLFILAKDLCVQKTFSKDLNTWDVPGGNQWKAEPPYCRPIPVVEFLRLMFGPSIWSNGGEDTFAHWYLNLSHWISMDGKIWEKPRPDGVALPGRSDFMQRHWFRTSAVQCCRDQRVIDKVIPIYFNDNLGSSPTRFSQILISDRAQQQSSKSDLASITPQNTIGHDTSEPYITILLDLGMHVRPGVPAEAINLPNCLHIYAQGMTISSFPFLEEWPGALETLKDILSHEESPTHPYAIIAQLAAQCKIGKTVGDEHMLWDINPEDYGDYRSAGAISGF